MSHSGPGTANSTDATSQPANAPLKAVAETPPPSNQTYFPALDGIRALAFLMVFGAHYADLPWGWTGVDVFFVLSGFLITGILFDTRNDEHRARNFYVRRTLRIFPLYYGILLMLLLGYPVFRWEWNWAWLAWPAYAGNFLRGIRPFEAGSALQRLAFFWPISRTHPSVRLYMGHFWSLCVEEQFYLIWPWIIFRIEDRKKLLRICIVCVLLCPILRVVGAQLLPQFMLDQQVLDCWTPFRVDALLLGGVIALVRRGPSAPRLLAVARVGFGFMFTVTVIWFAFGATHRIADYALPPWRLTWGLSFVDLLSACMIILALEPRSVIFRIFNLRPLRWLGRISYGAYVYHDILHPILSRFIDQFGFKHAERAAIVIGLSLTLVLSWASFRWFESPFIRLKDRWAKAPNSTPAGNPSQLSSPPRA